METRVEDTNRAVVEHFLPALVHDDVDTMRPLVHDDVVWWAPASAAAKFGLARPLVGWDTIDWFGGNGWKAFVPGSGVLTVHHLVAEGDLVTAHYRRTAEVWEVADTAAAFARGSLPG